MIGEKVFFSFSAVSDPTKHRAYAEWYFLDHRPENLALPGVAHGERWVRTPECAAASQPCDTELDATQYVTMYWFRSPVADSVKEWVMLGGRALQWGRRPELSWVERLMTQQFVPVKGYVNSRVLVSAEVLPLRLMRGIVVVVAEFEGSGPQVDSVFHWYDHVHIPKMVDVDGVAGAWTFVDEAALARSADRVSCVRVHLFYLDGDPVETASRMNTESEILAAGDGAPDLACETRRFAGPLAAIAPWAWNWFDS
jgi:hypothetical protein